MKFNRIISLVLSCTIVSISMTSCRNKDIKKLPESESHISENKTEFSQTEPSFSAETVTSITSIPGIEYNCTVFST